MARLSPVLLLFLLLWPATGQADEHQLDILRQHLAQQEAQLAASTEQEQALREELALLEARLRDERQQLAELEQNLRRLRQQREKISRELDELLLGRDQAGEKVQQRLAAAYRLGEVGLLNILFSAESLEELLETQDYFHFVREHDRALIADYREQREALQASRQELEDLEQELQITQTAGRQQEQQLQATLAEQAEILRRVQSQKNLHRQARREIIAATEALASPLANRQGEPGKPEQFAWPVAGTVVTEFGQTVTGRLGTLSASRGLIIITDGAGTPVGAMAAGTVAHLGELPGYGKLVLIEHGQNYFSLLAGLATIEVQPGAEVNRGQVLGFMGSGAQKTANRLYLEIRHGVEPQDPRRWLPTKE